MLDWLRNLSIFRIFRDGDQRDLRHATAVYSLSLKPDDIIVATTQESLSQENMEEVAEQLKSAFGSERKVVVISHGFLLNVVSPSPVEKTTARFKR